MKLFGPITVYWMYSCIYELFGSMDNYRLHSRKEEDTKNLVSKRDVMIGVLFQQATQANLTFLFIQIDGNGSKNNKVPEDTWHHRIVAPYAFAAQYNHPIDGIVTETLSGVVAFFVSGMSPGTSVIFFMFATIKGIDDHCGFMLPWNAFHVLFGNNTAYHDIHHQVKGQKYNFLLGTYKPFMVVRREDGALVALKHG